MRSWDPRLSALRPYAASYNLPEEAKTTGPGWAPGLGSLGAALGPGNWPRPAAAGAGPALWAGWQTPIGWRERSHGPRGPGRRRLRPSAVTHPPPHPGAGRAPGRLPPKPRPLSPDSLSQQGSGGAASARPGGKRERGEGSISMQKSVGL